MYAGYKSNICPLSKICQEDKHKNTAVRWLVSCDLRLFMYLLWRQSHCILGLPASWAGHLTPGHCPQLLFPHISCWIWQICSNAKQGKGCFAVSRNPCAFPCVFQNSLHKQVEEMERDSLVTLNVERLKGIHGRIAVAWEAAGSISDVFPTSGVVCNL